MGEPPSGAPRAILPLPTRPRCWRRSFARRAAGCTLSVIPSAAWWRSRWRCAARCSGSLVDRGGPGGGAAAGIADEDEHYRAFRRDDGRLFRRLRGWQYGSDRRDDRLLRRARHVRLLARSAFAPTRWKRRRSTSSIGRARARFRCRRHRSRPSTPNPASLRGGASQPAVQRANALLSECLPGATLATIQAPHIS